MPSVDWNPVKAFPFRTIFSHTGALVRLDTVCVVSASFAIRRWNIVPLLAVTSAEKCFAPVVSSSRIMTPAFAHWSVRSRLSTRATTSPSPSSVW